MNHCSGNVNAVYGHPATKVILKTSVLNDVLAQPDILKNQNSKQCDHSNRFHFIFSFQISSTSFKTLIKFAHKSLIAVVAAIIA